MKDQDEIYEAATETPAFLGCPAHMPKTLQGGFDGTESSGAQGGEGVPPSPDVEALKKQGSKLKACNDRSYAKMVRIAELANECVLRTTHAEYAPGQYGQDYREFGKTMCEIRDLVGPGLVERFAAPDADADKAAKRAEYFRKHYSFCDGLFPIHFTNTEDGQMASCWIGRRRFTFDMDSNERDDGKFDCAAVIKDNGKVVATIETSKGKTISGKMVFEAFKAYVKYLSGSNAYKSHGGFLKQAVKRAAAAKAAKEVR